MRTGIAALSWFMKNLSFQVLALSTSVAEEARRRAREGATDHKSVVTDSSNAFPCRHCLRWAQSGERVILFPYSAIPAGHPYSESGPIFVHEQPCHRYETTAGYPSDFRTGRVFRAYNKTFDMIDAQIPNGSSPEAVIEKLFQNPETAFVDARSVDRGCFTFRIERK
jgi:hypothetical protein